MPLWTVDATSGIAIPQSSAEWLVFLAQNGLVNWSAPDALHPCQEASGNLADSIGAFPLTAGGTAVTYQTPVSGWSTLGLQFADNSTSKFSSVSASLPDISAASALNLIIAVVTSSAARALNAFGTTSFRVQNLTTVTPRFQISSNANTATGTVSPINVVRPYIVQSDHAAGASHGFTDQEVLTPTRGSPTGKQFIIGAFGVNAPAMQVLYSVSWFTTKAERTQVDVGELLEAMGFAPSWETPIQYDDEDGTPWGRAMVQVPLSYGARAGYVEADDFPLPVSTMPIAVEEDRIIVAPMQWRTNTPQMQANEDEFAYQYVSSIVGATGSVGANGPPVTNTYNKPAGTASGDLLVMISWNYFGASDPIASAPSGFVKKTTASLGTSFLYEMWFKLAGGSEPSTYTFTYTNTGEGPTAAKKVGTMFAIRNLQLSVSFIALGTPGFDYYAQNIHGNTTLESEYVTSSSWAVGNLFSISPNDLVLTSIINIVDPATAGTWASGLPQPIVGGDSNSEGLLGSQYQRAARANQTINYGPYVPSTGTPETGATFTLLFFGAQQPVYSEDDDSPMQTFPQWRAPATRVFPQLYDADDIQGVAATGRPIEEDGPPLIRPYPRPAPVPAKGDEYDAPKLHFVFDDGVNAAAVWIPRLGMVQFWYSAQDDAWTPHVCIPHHMNSFVNPGIAAGAPHTGSFINPGVVHPHESSFDNPDDGRVVHMLSFDNPDQDC